MANANSNVSNDLVNCCNETKRGAGDQNRTRVLSLGSAGQAQSHAIKEI